MSNSDELLARIAEALEQLAPRRAAPPQNS